MIMDGIPGFGWPQTHADWSVTWEAIGAIGTTLAFGVAAIFGIIELRRFRQLRQEELLSHRRSISFAFQTTEELGKHAKATFIATNGSQHPFKKVSVLEVLPDEPGWYSSSRELIFGEVVNETRLDVERLRPFGIANLRFVFEDRYGQIWMTAANVTTASQFDEWDLTQVRYQGAIPRESIYGTTKVNLVPYSPRATLGSSVRALLTRRLATK